MLNSIYDIESEVDVFIYKIFLLHCIFFNT